MIGDGELPEPDDETRACGGAGAAAAARGRPGHGRTRRASADGAGSRMLDLEGCRAPRDLALLACRFDATPLLRSAEHRQPVPEAASCRAVAPTALTATGDVYLRDVEADRDGDVCRGELGGTSTAMARRSAEKDARAIPARLSADWLEAAGGVFLRGVEGDRGGAAAGAQLGGRSRLRSARHSARSRTETGNPGTRFSARRAGRQAAACFCAGCERPGRCGCSGRSSAATSSATTRRSWRRRTPRAIRRYALSADGLNARGSVFLTRVQATGEVRLLGAKLGGASTATARRSGRRRMPRDRTRARRSTGDANVTGAFLLGATRRSTGVLDLTAAEVGASATIGLLAGDRQSDAQPLSLWRLHRRAG